MWPLQTFLWSDELQILSYAQLPKGQNHRNYDQRQAKNLLSAIFSKRSILRYMLLHKLYMAISHILVYTNCLYELSGPECKNSGDRETLEKSVAQNALIASRKSNEGQMF